MCINTKNNGYAKKEQNETDLILMIMHFEHDILKCSTFEK